MNDKNNNDKNKIGKIDSTSRTERVKKTEQVSAVDKVTGADSVSGVGSTRSVGRRATRFMSIEEREKYFNIIAEETQNLLAGKVPPDKIAQVENAVKMAIDAGLIEKDKEK